MRRIPRDFRTVLRRWRRNTAFEQALRQWLAAEEEGTPVPFRLDEVHHCILPLPEPETPDSEETEPCVTSSPTT